MDNREEKINSFIGHLRRIGSPSSPDRGALAELRSGLGQKPGSAPRMHKHIVPYLGEKLSRDDKWFYLVGALFGSNPDYDESKTIGTCFRALSSHSDSIESRFVALLESHSEDIDKHLTYAISMIKSKNMGLNYRSLLSDLIRWDHPERVTQNKWARDFYKNINTKNQEKTND